MKTITINKVEGKTDRKGLKQNKTYNLLYNHGIVIDSKGRNCDLTKFWTATDGKNEFSIWNVEGDWSLIGISKSDRLRYTYTRDFKIE